MAIVFGWFVCCYVLVGSRPVLYFYTTSRRGDCALLLLTCSFMRAIDVCMYVCVCVGASVCVNV